jgi:hypothetical protein
MEPSESDEEERVSLHPFTFEEALSGLMAVDPADIEDDEEEPEQPD